MNKDQNIKIIITESYKYMIIEYFYSYSDNKVSFNLLPPDKDRTFITLSVLKDNFYKRLTKNYLYSPRFIKNSDDIYEVCSIQESDFLKYEAARTSLQSFEISGYMQHLKPQINLLIDYYKSIRNHKFVELLKTVWREYYGSLSN